MFKLYVLWDFTRFQAKKFILAKNFKQPGNRVLNGLYFWTVRDLRGRVRTGGPTELQYGGPNIKEKPGDATEKKNDITDVVGKNRDRSGQNPETWKIRKRFTSSNGWINVKEEEISFAKHGTRLVLRLCQTSVIYSRPRLTMFWPAFSV